MKWRSQIVQALAGMPALSAFAPEPAGAEAAVRAAVLVAVGVEPETGRESLLLTKRSQTVKTHRGQISFPGGLWEPEDRDLLCTALRETEEEVGLRPDHVEVVGRLPEVRTKGALPILPWVGYFSLPYDFRPNPVEVERILYLPLDRLVHEGLAPVKVPVGPVRISSVGIEVEREMVWGATARILEHLLKGLSGTSV